MRILKVTIFMAVLAILGVGILACAPATPAPATPTATPQPAFMPPSTLLPPPTPYGLKVTPPPGAVPASSVTKTYLANIQFDAYYGLSVPFEAKKGDIVVLSMNAEICGVGVGVNGPDGETVLVSDVVMAGRPARLSFQAGKDGRYLIYGGTSAMDGVATNMTITIDIYR